MLKFISIQNFQAHEKLRVDFAPGITTIVGPSDTGKSAVIRALRWVCDNTPAGDAFIRHGAKGCTVRLGVGDHVITRRRSPGGEVNEYKLDESEMKAFGRGVPEPVVRVLNLGPVCWQGQHDAPYWFTETAGEVSRQLNSIVNLGVIDDVLARVASARNRARTRLDVAEENLTTAKQTAGGLGWVVDFDAALKALEDQEAAATGKATRATGAAALVADAVRLEAARKNAAGAARTGETALKNAAEATKLREAVAGLCLLVDRVRALRRDAGVRLPDMQALDEAYEARGRKRTRAVGLKQLLEEAKQKEAEVCEAENEMKRARALLPKVCPVCGR